MFDFDGCVKAIHDNAVAHGWWTEKRTQGEICALIHSELSEALEEARAGRGEVWYRCGTDGMGCLERCRVQSKANCEARKPEGICVEIIDAAIRMMDYMGFRAYKGGDVDAMLETLDSPKLLSVGDQIDLLHDLLVFVKADGMNAQGCFTFCMACFKTVQARGEDWERILREKCAYNVGRPYRHGKRF